jgi:hypothetical protein
MPLWFPYIASLHYINTPKLALAHQLELGRSCQNKKRSSTSLSIFSLNLVENYQPVIELYQTEDHPALSPKNGRPEWRVAMAGKFGGFWITTWKTRQKYPPIDLAGGGGGRLHVVWFGSFSQRL